MDTHSQPICRLGAWVAIVLFTTSCDYGWPGIKTTPTMQAGVRTVRLLDVALSLHFAKAQASVGSRPVVLFATGDGGWRSIDREIVSTIAHLGYPVAGFSSPEYLRHLQKIPAKPTPARIGADYSYLIDNARQAMALPATTAVILSGFSRGAGLAVIAAGDARLERSLRGVLAMGLDDVEEHVQSQQSGDRAASKPQPMKTYEYLKSLGGFPLALIQSTHDRFLDAARARKFFGADTELHKLHAIDAESHTFSGARPLLFSEIERSLSWIETAERQD